MSLFVPGILELVSSPQLASTTRESSSWGTVPVPLPHSSLVLM